MNTTSPPEPYVGPRPFDRKDYARFFGRFRETDDLLSLVLAHPVVLLYAASGAGKSSLLNAGLIPRLIDEEFQILGPARVTGPVPRGTGEITNIYRFHALSRWNCDLSPCPATASELASLSLADFLHRLDVREPGRPRVLLFDQFEEFFAVNVAQSEQRNSFIEELAQSLSAAPRLKVVFAMREDYVTQFEPFAYILPGKLRTRMRLEPLRARAAVEAIREPLKALDLSLEEGTNDPAEALVRELLKISVITETGQVRQIAGEFVDPLQLQVVCQKMWHHLPPEVKAYAEERQTLSPEAKRPAKKIRADQVRIEDVALALAHHYERAITQAVDASGASEGQLRRWFGSTLITGAGVRGIALASSAETAQLPETALKVFLDQRLVRKELRGGSEWYELTHDRFIEAIQRSNRDWFEQRAVSEALRSKLAAKAETAGARLDESETREAEAFLASPESIKLGISPAIASLVKTSRQYVEEEKARKARELEDARKLAESERERAENAQLLAAKEKQRAEEQLAATQRLRRRAIALVILCILSAATAVLSALKTVEASRMRKKAEENFREKKHQTKIAQNERDNAIAQTKIAENERKNAIQQSKVARRESLRVRKQILNDKEIIITLADKLLESATPEEAAVWHMWKKDALAGLGRIPEAILEESAVLEKDPENVDALGALIYYYNTLGEPEKALAASDASLKKGYDHWITYQNRAQTLGLLGRYKEGEEAFRNSNEKFTVSGDEFSEQHVSPDILRATQRKTLTDAEVAIRAANYYGIANLRAYDGDPTFPQALEEARKQPSPGDAALIALNWAWMHMEKRPQDYGALIAQAALWEQAQLPAWAKKYYVEFERVHRQKADPRYDQLADWVGKRLQELQAVGEPVADVPDVQALLLEAMELVDQNQYKGALKCINEAIAVDPGNVSLLLKREEINSNLKDWDAVKQDSQTILEKAPRTSKAHAFCAQAMQKLGEPEDEVEKEFRLAVKYDMRDAYSMTDISDLVKQRNPDEALVWLEQSRRITADYSELAYVYQRIALIQTEKHLFPEALQSIETAITINRDEPRFYLNRADIERESGKTKETAVVRHLCQGYVQAGDTCLQIGRKAKACNFYWLSIEALAPLRNSKNERKLDHDIADTVSKISSVIESTASRAKAAEFWKTAIESGRWNGVRELFEKEERRLSAAR